jgi:MoaA/NifB/PqqE/SkfB family radical SAM enzyme/glycosyltransferase involved in cell wall biosynthesis
VTRVAILTRGDLFPANHGAAVKIVRTAEALAAAGDVVSVVTEDRDAYLRVVPGGAWERVPYGARARALEELPLLRDQSRWVRLCRRIGWPAEETFLYRPVVDPAWWVRALYVGVRERIDVYHAEFPGFAMPAWLASRALGGRAVVGTHNVEFDRLRQTTSLAPGEFARIRAVEALLLRIVDEVVACSVEDRDRLAAVGVPSARVRHIPHGVDVASFDGPAVDLRARYALPEGPVLFFHGTLHYAPNADAVRFLAQRLAPALEASGAGSVLVAGLSPPRELAGPRLVFAGPVDDLPGHIAGADLCVCPLFAGGGTRMKLLEYFAAGKPVVSTPLGAEGLGVVDDRELVLAEGPAFVDATLALLGDAPRQRRLGGAARAYARARDWSVVGEAWRAVHRGRGTDFSPAPHPAQALAPATDIEAHLPPRRPSKPLTLLFLVNRGCNLRCTFCDLWEGKARVPLARAVALFDDAVAIGTRTVVLTGGEPTLHPELPAMVRAAKERGLAVNVTTNGTLLDRHYVPLRDAGVDSLSFSIDGLPATHDRLRGQAGAHARTWAQLARVVAEGHVGASVYFVVTRENVRELVAVWEQVRTLGAGFDFWPVNDAPSLTLEAPEDQQAWTDAVEAIARHDPTVAARRHYYAEGLRYHHGERVPMRCLGLIDQYGVTYEGDLLPCCVWGGEGLRLGNVFERPLRELWYTPEVQGFRERMFRDGCAAGCYNHSLYEFTASTGLSHRVTAAGEGERRA